MKKTLIIFILNISINCFASISKNSLKYDYVDSVSFKDTLLNSSYKDSVKVYFMSNEKNIRVKIIGYEDGKTVKYIFKRYKGFLFDSFYIQTRKPVTQNTLLSIFVYIKPNWFLWGRQIEIQEFYDNLKVYGLIYYDNRYKRRFRYAMKFINNPPIFYNRGVIS